MNTNKQASTHVGKQISQWAHQEAVKDDVEDEHPQVPVAHVQSCPQPDQRDEQEQVEDKRHLCRTRQHRNINKTTQATKSSPTMFYPFYDY